MCLCLASSTLRMDAASLATFRRWKRFLRLTHDCMDSQRLQHYLGRTRHWQCPTGDKFDQDYGAAPETLWPVGGKERSLIAWRVEALAISSQCIFHAHEDKLSEVSQPESCTKIISTNKKCLNKNSTVSKRYMRISVAVINAITLANVVFPFLFSQLIK